MVQMHEGVEVEVIAEVMDLPDMPPGDELSGADAYDDLEDHPYECRATGGGRHSLAAASGVSDLPSERSEREVRQFYTNDIMPGFASGGPAREGEDIMSITDTTCGPLSNTRLGTRSRSIGSADFNNFQDDDEDLSMSVPSQQSRS